MKLIFICVFNNPDYLKLLYLLLESIQLYGQLDQQTHILIYTSTNFRKIIKRSCLLQPNILFQINDNYENVTLACKARLDLFELPLLRDNTYQKILYLDTDILVKGNINPIFHLAKHDVIYAIEEGRLDDDRDFYGKSLFHESELNPHRGKSAFSSGVMLFNNCPTLRHLFQTIKNDIRNRPREFVCHDQPYIVYHAFRTGLYNHQAIKCLAVNNDLNIHSDKAIHHFPGNTGVYYNKSIEMIQFLSQLKHQTVQQTLDAVKNYINSHLLPILHQLNEPLEGNVLMEHQTTNYYPPYENKAKNIITVASNNKIKNILEIGFGSGFSSLLMLMANQNANVTSIDWMKHSYVKPCYLKIKETFGDRINLIEGDSRKVMKKLTGPYDLIHIDGNIFTEIVKRDIQNSIRLSQRTILIVDDYNYQHIRELWDRYVKKYHLQDIDILLFPTDTHSLKRGSAPSP